MASQQQEQHRPPAAQDAPSQAQSQSTTVVESDAPGSRPIEADDNDQDSSFGGDRDSVASSSTSLLSDITDYPSEHGRRYHAYKAGKYLFPNDEQELNRMDIEHHNQLLQLDGKLHLCPLKDPEQILDVGTGTGIWAIDMADQYPNAQIIGTDLSPVQPTWVPPNCKFEVDDLEQEWTFGENRFDLIHERFLMGSVSDYLIFFKNCYRALKPGGYLEIVEMELGLFSDDGTVTPDMMSHRWGKAVNDAFATIGKRILYVDEFPSLIEEAGFEDVHYEIKRRPTNDWPRDPRMKEIGRFSCLNYLEGIEGFTIAPLTRILQWKREEVDILLAGTRGEHTKRSIHGWHKGCVVYARKPLH